MIKVQKEDLTFEESIYTDKSKIKKVYTVGLVLFLLAVICIVWATIYWEDYTYLTKNVVTGRVRQTGIASILYGWGWGFVIVIPVVYGIMWTTLDFNNPILAVNKDGLYINKEGIKKTFLSWEEFSINTNINNGDLELRFKEPEKIVALQKGIIKAFVKQSYVKQKLPFVIKKEQEIIITFIAKYLTSN